MLDKNNSKLLCFKMVCSCWMQIFASQQLIHIISSRAAACSSCRLVLLFHESLSCCFWLCKLLSTIASLPFGSTCSNFDD